MLFNSFNYALFLPIVFIVYWFVVNKKLKFQNIWLLISSYYFYAFWDYRFLFLLIFSTGLDYFTGLMMDEATSSRKRKFWFWLSISINLGFLGLFKYFNFFVESFAQLVSNFGLKADITTLKIILPVGISFYTFHGLSYVIDIYKKRMTPVRDFTVYAVFLSFFPLLVAGPIERATHLLPQIQKKRKFNYVQAINGLRQILWGLFKKVVIADNCAEYANLIFNNSDNYSGSALVLGAVFFAIQIYCDFSGYSDIALGTARLFGIELLRNFAFPYFSRDIAEFWRRWHISLSTWFRDYLYIPLGGSRSGLIGKIRNTFIIFLVSGFWHGANWTYIAWGALNAFYFLPLLLLNKNRDNIEIVAKGKLLPSFRDFFSILSTFSLTVLAWIFFRSQSITQAVTYLINIFNISLFKMPVLMPAKLTILFCCFFIMIEWIGRENEYALERFGIKWPRYLRHIFYMGLVISIFLFNMSDHQFIYFQF